jgi:hypothetical protein
MRGRHRSMHPRSRPMRPSPLPPTCSCAPRSYVYSIDGRGRQLLQRHGLFGALEEAGVSTEAVRLTRVYPDGRKQQQLQTSKVRVF